MNYTINSKNKTLVLLRPLTPRELFEETRALNVEDYKILIPTAEYLDNYNGLNVEDNCTIISLGEGHCRSGGLNRFSKSIPSKDNKK